MAADHPLAAQRTVRLRDCCAWPLALPVRGFGGRRMVDRALYGKTYARAPALESNSFEYLKAHVAATRAVTFQIGIGAPQAREAEGLAGRALDPRDVPPGSLFLGQKPGRLLPVAASRFAEQLIGALSRRYALERV